MNENQRIVFRIEALEKRNSLVDQNKAWEMSWMRKIIIAILTYLFISGYLIYLGTGRPWLNAIVPMVGFLLSTLTLGIIKKVWVEYFYSKKR